MDNKLAKIITVITLIATMLLAGCSEEKGSTLIQYKSTDSEYDMLMKDIFNEQFITKFNAEDTVEQVMIGKECYKDGKLTSDEKVISMKLKEDKSGILGILFTCNREQCIITTDDATVSSDVREAAWMKSGAYVTYEDEADKIGERKIKKGQKEYIYAASKGKDEETISPQLDPRQDNLNKHGRACYYYVMFE